MKPTVTFASHGWIAAAGLALAAIGLTASPQTGGQGGQGQGGQTTSVPITTTAGAVTADSNNRMIAVTGIDITGASILYLVDTVNYRLAVYQATGGSESTQGVKLVGARRIDLDLLLHGLNDKSKYTYERLREEFSTQGLLEDAGER